MLDVNIDRSGSIPLHDQVAAQIRRAIAEGRASLGRATLTASVAKQVDNSHIIHQLCPGASA